jgi:hypothetical protein
MRNFTICNLPSQNVFGVIKSRKMNWMGKVVYIEEMRNPYRVLMGKPEGKTPLGNWRTV